MRVKMKKSNLVDALSSQKSCSNNPDTAIINNHHHVVCPKPRRPPPSIPELLRPFRCTHHRCTENEINEDKSTEKWRMMDLKVSGKGVGIECGCGSESRSPPRRTQNPVIHDLRFIHQMELLPPLSSFPPSTTAFSPF